jgi:hypothetical protein
MESVVIESLDEHRDFLGDDHKNLENDAFVLNTFQRIDLDELLTLDVVEFSTLSDTITL